MAKIQNYLANIAKTNSKYRAIVSQYDLSSRSHFNDDDIAIVIKDNFCTTELPTSCASKALENYVSPFESTCTQLLKDAGMVLIGKANMDEFAMGSDNRYTHYGQCLNPAFTDARSPGGSSGGSAAAVAADYCDVATGTDTGGSVRLPAAYCSVLGFKPTYGLLSRHGVVAYAQSFDTVGLAAKQFKPLKKVFDILNKYDPNDPTSLTEDIRARLPAPRKPGSLNIGVINDAILDIDPLIRLEWQKTLENLESMGHKVHFVDVPSFKYSLHTYFMLAPSEASSNLARYDGVRYGYRAENDADQLLYAATRSESLGEEVKRRIILGTYNMSSTALENHFFKAQKMRGQLVDDLNAIFKTPHVIRPSEASGYMDVIIHPTARNLPPKVDQLAHTDPVDDYTNDILTVPANIAGIPAISVPTSTPGVGMQVWGQFGEDHLVLDVAEQISLAGP